MRKILTGGLVLLAPARIMSSSTKQRLSTALCTTLVLSHRQVAALQPMVRWRVAGPPLRSRVYSHPLLELWPPTAGPGAGAWPPSPAVGSIVRPARSRVWAHGVRVGPGPPLSLAGILLRRSRGAARRVRPSYSLTLLLPYSPTLLLSYSLTLLLSHSLTLSKHPMAAGGDGFIHAGSPLRLLLPRLQRI